ncbi:hypothetical protein [Pseudonocardia adelaidensis]|uniref:Uncharacterized protein n=1 Tax=Pseudonocardia adelaidensis TaxID=648754 RepID=A0ABP9NH98_9PSEU
MDDLADGLVALTRGAPPRAPGLPFAFLAELLLVVAAVATMLGAGRAVLRSPRWARRRAGRTGAAVMRLVPYLLPLLLLAVLPRAAAPVVGGATFRDLAEVWPTALVAAEVVAAAGAVVVATRLLALARLRRGARRGVSPRTEP